MSDLLMPSEAKRAKSADGVQAPEADPATTATATTQPPLIEPPSVKLIVRLFLIPLLIVGAAVGVMYLVGLLAGGTPTIHEVLTRLKSSGGGRTADVFIGPGSKQRYLDATALVELMRKSEGLSTAERIEISDSLVDILNNHTNDDEGEVRNFLLMALGRAWQLPQGAAADPSSEATRSRTLAIETLIRYADSQDLEVRKAAVAAFGFLGRQPASRAAIPLLIEKLNDSTEHLDVRLLAATMLGPVASPTDQAAIAALSAALRDTDPRHSELVWQSALSLAQLGQQEVADTILMLLDRDELAQLRFYDRESDPQNPTFRLLSDQEQQRFLINTMEGVAHYDVPAVQQRLHEISRNDPSKRVRAAAIEVLNRPDRAPPTTTAASS